MVNNLSEIILDIVNKLEDEAVVKFIANKAKEMSDDLKINQILGNGIEYILQKRPSKKLITNLSSQIKITFWRINEIVQGTCKKESYKTGSKVLLMKKLQKNYFWTF